MFTGIIEEVGKILSISKDSITVNATKVLDDVKIGDSIAVNGVCLTVTEYGNNYFKADLSQETFRVTSFEYSNTGCLVNLERALMNNGRFGGHIVTGHIDGIGKVYSIKYDSGFYNVEFTIDKTLSKYVVKKGSIAINGISLTVADTIDNRIKTAIIPHTYEITNLKQLKQNDFINIETDIISKYVEKFLSTSDNRTGISIEFLKENGF